MGGGGGMQNHASQQEALNHRDFPQNLPLHPLGNVSQILTPIVTAQWNLSEAKFVKSAIFIKSAQFVSPGEEPGGLNQLLIF